MNACFDQAQQLSLEEQLDLVEALWDGIVKRNAVPCLTEAQQREIDSRLADYEANPGDVLAWHEVKAAALARIGR